ncbi:MAG: ligase-associated DNA damage response endonuclease PdeM [Azospirillum sp.]|nr:ligase-associated DNA damage response endonuclease PdeM [Azospirillum sp.]
MVTSLRVNGATVFADPSGALVWPECDLLVVADLHLEKGSGFAARGRLLPPYDTRATLDRLAAVLLRHRPRRVVCLGDSFHDGGAGERMADPDAERLAGLVRSHDWLWVTGNHDPAPPDRWGGRVEAAVTTGGLCFRHQAEPAAVGEVSGHFHPIAVVRTRARRIRGRCFAGDGARLILPAFGAYTGGLSVLDPALRGLFGAGLAILLMARDRLHGFPAAALAPQ